MVYVWMFLPAICSAVALAVSLAYGREKSALVIAAVAAAGEALGDDGSILVRESGTEPVIRVMVEAENDVLCAKYVDQVIDVMKAEVLVLD